MTRKDRIQWENLKIFPADDYESYILYWRMRPIFEGTKEECEKYREEHYTDLPSYFRELVAKCTT